MATLKAAGCDQILVFGGFPVYETQKPYFFGTSTVVDPTGAPTDNPNFPKSTLKSAFWKKTTF